MFTVTFYSFKGGVGRTLALMNIASELAKTGKNVAVIDFDLEAPGLDTFECFRHTLPRYGLLDFVAKYSESYNSGNPEIPDIKNFIGKSKKKAFAHVYGGRENFTSSNKTGDVWLMPAKGEKSTVELSQIRFKELYEKKDGYLLFEELRQLIKKETKADYLLVDSRTGYADHSYICTNQLADALVVVFFPNVQNQKGIHEIVEKVRLAKKVDESKILFVASRIPTGDDETNLLSDRMSKFAEKLEIPEQSILKLHHNSSFELLDQSIFSLVKTPTTQLFRDYQTLTDEIEMLNPQSRRGAILTIRELLESRQGNRVVSMRDYRNRRAKPERRLLTNKEKRHRMASSLIREYSEIFIDDVAISTELANYFESERPSFANFARKQGLIVFLFKLNAFLLHDEPIEGLSYDPLDPFEVIRSLLSSRTPVLDFEESTFGRMFVSASRRRGEDPFDEPFPSANIQRLQHAGVPMGKLLDEVLEEAIVRLPKYFAQQKEQRFLRGREGTLCLAVIFLSKRNAELKHMGRSKYIEWTEDETDVIDYTPQSIVYRTLSEVFDIKTGMEIPEGYLAIRASLARHFHDFGTEASISDHSKFFDAVGTEALRSWTATTTEEYFRTEVSRPNSFLKEYLPILLSLLNDDTAPEITGDLCAILDEDVDQMPPNRFAGCCILVKLLGEDPRGPANDPETDGFWEEDEAFYSSGISKYLEKREREETTIGYLQQKKLKTEKEIARITESMRDETLLKKQGSGKAVPPKSSTEYKKKTQFLLRAKRDEIRSLEFEFQRLSQGAASPLSGYFSFLSFQNLDLGSVFEELKFINDCSQAELERAMEKYLFNKNSDYKVFF